MRLSSIKSQAHNLEHETSILGIQSQFFRPKCEATTRLWQRQKLIQPGKRFRRLFDLLKRLPCSSCRVNKPLKENFLRFSQHQQQSRRRWMSLQVFRDVEMSWDSQVETRKVVVVRVDLGWWWKRFHETVEGTFRASMRHRKIFLIVEF